MSPLKAARALALATAVMCTAAPAHADSPYDPAPGAWHELGETYLATSTYAYEPFAARDGYEGAEECAVLPGEGGMGYHYVNPDNIDSLEPSEPAALLYEQKDGRRGLVAVEWIVRDTGQARPMLFGRQFGGPFTDVPGLPKHYALHAWLYKENPKGVFHPWNPEVRCPIDRPRPTP
ncbi:hypothetical protein [Streptomyces heilongjiangensis]|uniref:Uncharacterized protein n=1 Tax=Streptomyces heilongjiangensis TaxID=945052 RepID=A0ABW1BCC8_9ACTN|nr:hypothetical protein [Streptomyces heilongjiangensis]MDC2950280.1 hypothetical protein [Streptomyces heilongjiangensis]